MNPDDIQDLMGPFLAEAEDFIRILEDQLLQLESVSDHKSGTLAVKSLFRAAHSLKGSALMFGFSDLAATAHQLEDCFGILREQAPDLTQLSPEIMTALLQGVDALKLQMNALAAGQTADMIQVQQSIEFLTELHQVLEQQFEPVAVVAPAGPGVDQGIIQAIFEYEFPPVLEQIETQLSQLQPETLAQTLDRLSTLQAQLSGAARILQIPALEQIVLDFKSIISRVDLTAEILHELGGLILAALQTSRDAVLQNQPIEWPGLATLAPPQLLELNALEDTVTAPSWDWVEPDLPEMTDDLFNSLDTVDFTSDVLSDVLSEPLTETPQALDGVEADSLVEMTDDLFGILDSEDFTPDTLSEDLPLTEATDPILAVPETPDWEAWPSDPVTAGDPSLETPLAEADLFALLDPPDALLSEANLEADAEAGITPDELVLPISEVSRPSEPVPIAKSQPVSPVSLARPTIRVDLQQLNELVNLVGELVINRNNLALQETHLRTEARRLQHQATTLNHTGSNLREDYDRLTLPQASQSVAQSAHHFDALEMDQYTEFHITAQAMMETTQHIGHSASSIDQLATQFESSLDQLHRITNQLRHQIMQLRVVPFSRVVDHLPRALRDLCRTYGKEVNLLLVGRDTKIDESLLEALREPLLHLVRNAFDHGIESPDERQAAGKPSSGQIEIEARHQGGQTLITITDDGRGINPDVIRTKIVAKGLASAEQAATFSVSELYDFLFKPGFSTAATVTDLSGRGVGLDVVRANLETVRGTLRLDSRVGLGTTFTLRLPLVLSIIPALIVQVQDETLAVPLDAVEEILSVPPQALQQIGPQPLLVWQDDCIRMVLLSDLLQYPQGPLQPAASAEIPVLIMIAGDDIVAVPVNKLLGQQDIVVKPLPDPLPKLKGIAGSTLLGSGQVILILDVNEVFNYGGTSTALPEPMAVEQSRPSHILIVDDAYAIRQLLSRTFKRSHYQVSEAKDGQEALELLQAGLECDGVITDLEMPRMDGFELVQALRSDPHLQTLPVAILTSRSGGKHRQLAQELGVTTYFTKPYQEADLLAGVAAMLGQESSH